MTLDDAYALLDRIALVDDRVLRADAEEGQAQAEMWAVILADVPLDYAGEAVGRHYSRSPFPVRPSDIADQWRRTVRDRVERHTERRAPVDNPDDELAYRRALHQQRQAVATGEQPPAAVQALTAAVGRPMPGAPVRDEVRAQFAAALPGYQQALKTTPELAVACPVDTCRALPQRPCTRPGRGGTRHRLTEGTHPSRTDAYLAQQQGAAS